MTAGGNWWWAYEIGCIQAGYRHWQGNATIAMTMPFDEMTEVSGADGPNSTGRAISPASSHSTSAMETSFRVRAMVTFSAGC